MLIPYNNRLNIEI